MYKGKTFLAIIPARGGSKRLPRKNILDLNGKPLIAWSIEAALNSKYIDRVVVSTDDNEIALISKKYGAEVPFMRPLELSGDASNSASVVKDMIHRLSDMGENYECVMLLQPTSPLRDARHIDCAIKSLIDKGANSIVSVCEVKHPVEWTNTIPSNLLLDDFLTNKVKNKRSQDFPRRYQLNGAIYLLKIKKFLDEESLFLQSKCYAQIMEYRNSVDIDDADDLLLAECIMKNHHTT